MDFVTFLNARPFQESESLEFAKRADPHFGFRHQDQALPVGILRTMLAARMMTSPGLA